MPYLFVVYTDIKRMVELLTVLQESKLKAII